MPAKWKRCVACLKPLDQGTLCPRCKKQMDVRYPTETLPLPLTNPTAEKEDLMASKKSKPTPEPFVDCAEAADAAPETDDSGDPFPGVDYDTDEADAEGSSDAAEAETDEVEEEAETDEVEEEAETDEVEEEGESEQAPRARKEGRTYLPHATRAVASVLARLELFDWEKIGDSGSVRGAIAMLRNAQPKLEELAKKKRRARGVVAPGATVRIKSKSWDDILAPEDREGLRVLEIKGKLAKVATQADERLFIPVRDLAVES